MSRCLHPQADPQRGSQPATCEHRSPLLHPLPKQLPALLRPRRGAPPINHPLRSLSAEELNPFVTAALLPPTPLPAHSRELAGCSRLP